MLSTVICNTPFGFFEIKAHEQALCSIRLLLQPPQVPVPEPAPNSVAIRAAEQLQAYFAGKLREFDLPIDWGNAPEFYQSVWACLLRIPYGHTTSYAAIAQELGAPKAVRAVGMANRNNPIAIVAPCHRVIGKSGHLQGYFYGLEMKRRLLALENPLAFAEQGTLF